MSKSTKAANHQPDAVENIESALNRSEEFILKNRKSLGIIVSGILIAIALYMGFNKFYLTPLNDEAMLQMFVAEQYFEKDSFNMALKGDGINAGFLEIADEYSITPSGNLAKYYAGISYLRLGQFEEAIAQLKSFDSKDKMIGNIALGAIGDAYAELGNNKEAISYYNKAAARVSNDFSSPIYLFRAGLLYEKEGQYDNAMKMYKKIQAEFPGSTEGRVISKYIARIEALPKAN